MASPKSTPNLGTPKSSSSFMPAFLIGNMNTPVNQAKSLQSAVGSVPASSSTLLKPRMSSIEAPKGQSAGPPVVPLNRLFQSPKSPSVGQGGGGHEQHDENMRVTGSATILHQVDESSMNVEVQSPSQLDPFFQEGGEPNHDPTWITVFGFTSSATAFILKQFRQYGVILQHVTNQDGGNWVHIQYKTKIQARKALSKNGKIYEGKIMIGVVPCISVPQQHQQPLRESTDMFNKINGSASEYHTPPRTFGGMRRMDKSRSVSHLAASPSVRQLSQRSTNLGTPTKASDSVLGRVGSYIFNW